MLKLSGGGGNVMLKKMTHLLKQAFRFLKSFPLPLSCSVHIKINIFMNLIIINYVN